MNTDLNQSQSGVNSENQQVTKKPDVGAGPVKSVPDGGQEGEAKQPKEHTGKETEMGGSTGGNESQSDANVGNDNTGTA